MKILVVDDKPYVLSALKRSLEDIGHLVEIVSNASDALDMIDLFRGTVVDLVVTDYNMSGMNGCELAQKIRARSFKMPIWLLTASDIEEGTAKAAGVTKVFSKSTFRELLTAIENLKQK